MSDFDPEQFESELRVLHPARPPRKAVDGILKNLPSQAAQPSTSVSGFGGRWPGLLKILIPAAAVTVLLATWAFQHQAPVTQPPRLQHASSAAHSPLKADKVEIDRQLLADFEAVGKLPSGEPVRFRCQQWMEKVKLRDTAKGLVVEQTAPHLEIIPVRFETY